MTEEAAPEAGWIDPAWIDAVTAAALFAVDPAGTGGILVRAAAGPVRDRFLAVLRALLPADVRLRRMPASIEDGRLLGGLDLAATLRAGRPVAERGLLADADVVVIAMAERLPPGTAARLGAVLDAGEVAVQRDGLALRMPAAIGVVALDEGVAEDERMPAGLADRLGFRVALDGIGLRAAQAEPPGRVAVAAARARLALVDTDPEALEALCGTALALGAESSRAAMLALRVARAAAALAGRGAIATEDAECAARLVLAPRATRLPASDPPPADAEAPQPEPPESGGETDNDDAAGDADRPLDEVVLQAAAAALPPGLLAALAAGRAPRAAAAGRAGQQVQAARRGRPFGVRRGSPGGGNRLNVIETLRAAAPWQMIRRREVEEKGARRGVGGRVEPGHDDEDDAARPRIAIRRDDFRIVRFRHRSETTTIFVVDASGSAALQRLAEAKGAVELLLADCYVRRDRVALLAFRGQTVELLLPPTGSLVRAKRSLAGLPGGGGTPIAAAIDAACRLADAVRRRGHTPSLVFLTDGRANIARDGTPGRARAEADALAAARLLAAAGFAALLLDTSPRPAPQAERLAAAMGARYRPLPYADAGALSSAVMASTAMERAR
jgi:magnesium chelatase subunit D